MKFLKKEKKIENQQVNFFFSYLLFKNVFFSLPLMTLSIKRSNPTEGEKENFFQILKMTWFHILWWKISPPPHIYPSLLTTTTIFYYLYKNKGSVAGLQLPANFAVHQTCFHKRSAGFTNKRPPRQALLFSIWKILLICPCSVSVWSCWPASSSFWEVGLSV